MIPIPQLHLKLPVKPFSNCLELFGKEKEIDLEVCHSVRPRNVTHTDDAKIFLNRSLNFLSSVSLDDGRVGSIVVVSKSIPTYFIVRGLVIIFIVVHEPSNSCNKAAKGERQADRSGIRYYNESLAHIKHRSFQQKNESTIPITGIDDLDNIQQTQSCVYHCPIDDYYYYPIIIIYSGSICTIRRQQR